MKCVFNDSRLQTAIGEHAFKFHVRSYWCSKDHKKVYHSKSILQFRSLNRIMASLRQRYTIEININGNHMFSRLLARISNRLVDLHVQIYLP